MILSYHAVTRFNSRYRPDLTEAESRRELASVVATSREIGPTLGGRLWHTNDSPPIPFVVRNDPKVGLVVVTVLPSNGRAIEQDDLLAVVEAYRRAVKPQPLHPTTAIQLAPSPKEERKTRGLAENWLNLEVMRLRATAASLDKQRLAAPIVVQSQATTMAKKLVADQVVSLNAKIERMGAALQQSQLEQQKPKEALKIAVRALMALLPNHVAQSAIESIGEVERGYLVPAFWSTEHFTKSERKRQAQAVRAETTE